MGNTRKVQAVVQSMRQTEGAGFVVNRPFPRHGIVQVDPFLLLDEMGPSEHKPGEASGAPDHPHRGFETVTYLLAGEMEHQDSQGNRGVLRPGDVQWMTAGDGVIHSEMPTGAFQKAGGRMHGFQLWVNLPRGDKRMRPRYQDVSSDRIPTATSADGRVSVKVIAGEALGARAVIDTRVPITYLHAKLQPGAQWEQPLPADANAFAYLIAGEGRFGDEREVARRGQIVLFERRGDSAQSENTGDQPLELLLIAGRPLEEPLARYGPFVMNSEREIAEAIKDYPRRPLRKFRSPSVECPHRRPSSASRICKE